MPVKRPIIPNVSSTCLCSICLAYAVFLSPLTAAILIGSCLWLILLWCSVLLLKLSPKAHSLDPFLAWFTAYLVTQRSVSRDLSGPWGVSLLFRFAGIINENWGYGMFLATKNNRRRLSQSSSSVWKNVLVLLIGGAVVPIRPANKGMNRNILQAQVSLVCSSFLLSLAHRACNMSYYPRR